MKTHPMLLCLLALGAVTMFAVSAQAGRISTADPGGADVELRESQPTTNRGGNSEIASRIDATAFNRNSVIYLKFGVADISATELAFDITVRTTYRNTNISPGRIEHCCGGNNTGFDYYVLDPTIDGADWDETTIAPTTSATTVAAPAYDFDGNFKTKATGGPGAPTEGLTYLGTNIFDNADLVGASPHMPVGGNFDLVAAPGSALHCYCDSSDNRAPNSHRGNGD
jgi:hypothetical protein